MKSNQNDAKYDRELPVPISHPLQQAIQADQTPFWANAVILAVKTADQMDIVHTIRQFEQWENKKIRPFHMDVIRISMLEWPSDEAMWQRFVSSAHAQQIKVIVDWIPSDLGAHLETCIKKWENRVFHSGIDGIVLGQDATLDPESRTALKRRLQQAYQDHEITDHPHANRSTAFSILCNEAAEVLIQQAYYQGHLQARYSSAFSGLVTEPYSIEPVYDLMSNLINEPMRYLIISTLDGVEPDAMPKSVIRLIMAPGSIECQPAHLKIEGMRRLSAFRKRHPSVGAGRHALIHHKPYLFHRQLTDSLGNVIDQVVVGFDAPSGQSLLIPVHGIFADGAWIREANSGVFDRVKYGSISFVAPENGVLLLEEVKYEELQDLR